LFAPGQMQIFIFNHSAVI